MKKIILFLAVGVALTTQTLFAQVPSYVPSNGLVGYWPFNGNANDESGIGNNGTAEGATLTSDRFGNVNKAYNFDGLNDVINLPLNSGQIANSSQFTIQYWILPDGTITTSQTVFANWDSEPNVPYGTPVGFISGFNGDNSGINIYTGYVSNFGVGSNSNINFSNWNHVIIVFDGSQTLVEDRQKVFLNGILQSNNFSCQNCSNNIPQTIGDIYNHTSIGGRYVGPQNTLSEKFKGNIDDIGIWNRALTQQEITNLYNSSLPQTACLPANVPTTGLVGYWPFCGNANDESGNGNNGTNNGATLTADRFGNSNSAYSFNGQGENIKVLSINNSTFENDFSISLWCKNSNFSNDYGHLVYGQNQFIVLNNNGPIYNSSSAKISGYQGPYDNPSLRRTPYLETNSQLNINTNYHVVYTKSNNIAYIYINGVLENSISTNNTLALPSGSFIEFGSGFIETANYSFNGTLDDIGIWNRALTQQEITNLYNANQCITNITVTDTLIINVGQLSFNDPVTWANNITIAPNPASTEVNINFNNITNLNGGTLKIINSLGQEVATTPITTSGTNSTMQLATWGGTGMYFVQIINPQGQIVDIKKIILQ